MKAHAFTVESKLMFYSFIKLKNERQKKKNNSGNSMTLILTHLLKKKRKKRSMHSH